MTDDDPTDEISDIEDRIERLAEIAERCRKYILASKIAIGAGSAAGGDDPRRVWIWSDCRARFDRPGARQDRLARSNVSTLRQTDEAISAAEARRAALIGSIDLRVVADAPLKLV